MPVATMDVSRDNAIEASAFLKTLANENRLMVLCHLAQGEKTVTELESLLERLVMLDRVVRPWL